MTTNAAAAWPAPETRILAMPPRRAAAWAAAHRAIIGSRRTAENLDTQARPKRSAESANVPAPGRSRGRHQAPTDASMKSAMHTSDVAYPPWARKAGQKAKNARDTSAPASPNSRLDQQNTRAPRATLKRAVIARAAMSLGKWS